MILSPRMLTFLKWTGTLTGVAGALILALNLPFSGWGWVLFAISALTWTIAGIVMRELSLVLLQVGFLVVDVLGIYRWLVV